MKINQKSIQNPSQIDQKSIKIRFGSLLAPSDRPGGILGRLGGILARKRWPTWLQLGSQNGAKIEKKSKPNATKIWMPLGVGFLKDFGGFGKAKWSQVGIRIASQIDPNFERRFFEKTLFFLRKTDGFEGSGV